MFVNALSRERTTQSSWIADAGDGWIYGGQRDPSAAIREAKTVPIIALTANAFAEDISKVLASG